MKRDTTAEKKKKRGLTFFLIILVSTIFTIILHQVRHDPLMTLSTKARSIVSTSGYFPPAAIASIFIAFCIMGVTFLAIQKTICGARLRKGVLFGIALGGMYLVGMIEAYVAYPVSFFGELYTGMVDGCGIFLMSLLLGRYMSDDIPEQGKPAIGAFPAILIIPVIYIIVRYFSYAVLHIDSSYSTRSLETFLWTAGMGCWCGIMYIMIGRNIWRKNSLKQALTFGGLVFGINWVVYNLFVLLFIRVPISDLLLRSIFDSLAVMLGVYLSSILSSKRVSS